MMMAVTPAADQARFRVTAVQGAAAFGFVACYKGGVASTFRSAAERLRAELRRGRVTPDRFRSALAEIALRDRDPWLDLVWDIGGIPLDGPELPRGCVPYLPCAVAAVLDALEHARVTGDDVFVDVGAGLGRAALLAHLATDASCVGLEIQPRFVQIAQQRADRLQLGRLRFLHGDAAEMVRTITTGTVFFLYCPFSGSYLRRCLEGLEGIARAQPIRVCCVDMPLLEAPWLTRVSSTSLGVDVYRSALPR